MSTSAPSAAEREPQPRAFDIKRAAIILGINASHVRRLAQRGHIASIRAGRRFLFTEKNIQDFLATGCAPVSDAK